MLISVELENKKMSGTAPQTANTICCREFGRLIIIFISSSLHLNVS